MLLVNDIESIRLRTLEDHREGSYVAELRDNTYGNKPIVWSLLDRLCGPSDEITLEYDSELAKRFGLEVELPDVLLEEGRSVSTSLLPLGCREENITIVTTNGIVREHWKIGGQQTTLYRTELTDVVVTDEGQLLGSTLIMHRTSGAGPYMERGFLCVVDEGRLTMTIARLPEVVIAGQLTQAAA